MNLFDVLETAARYVPTKDAVRFQEDAEHIRTISYQKLLELASRFSGGLAKLGVKRGDRVAVFLPNLLEYPIITYGILRIGAVPVLLSSALKEEGAWAYVERSGARVLVTADELWKEGSLSSKTPDAKGLLETIVTGKYLGMYCLKNKFDALENNIPPKRDVRPSDPAFILYTSGTTGEQKGAILSHDNVSSNIQAVHRHTGMRSHDTALCFLPLFHCFGQNFVMNTTFYACGTLLLHKRFVLDEILASLQRHQATMFFSIPPNYRALLDLEDLGPFASVRYFFTAADTMPPEVARAWKEKYGRQIWEGWGLTETSPFATYNHDTEYVPGSVGTPSKDVHIEICDESGIRLGPGQIGEIVVKGPNVFQGYLNDPEATAKALRGGWFFTGDIGKLDERGYLFVVDRKNDRIKVNGFSVWPREIEKFVRECFGKRLKDIGVIGVSDQERGEMPFAYAVRGDSALMEQEIMDAVKEKFPGYYRLKGVAFVEAIPKTPTGKILKKELRTWNARA